jgi:hypothetical protein
MLYMVTFTINIPPMLAYILIYHTWILWVLILYTHHVCFLKCFPIHRPIEWISFRENLNRKPMVFVTMQIWIQIWIQI